jgi:hypothetical protein
MKQVIRLNENQIRRIVTESVKRVLNEVDDTEEFEPYEDMPQTEFDAEPEYDPEFEEHMRNVHPYTDEAKKLGEKMKPYLNRFNEIFTDNNYEIPYGIARRAKKIIQDALTLPYLAAHITTYEEMDRIRALNKK